MRTFDGTADRLLGLLRRLPAHIGLAARAQTGMAQLDDLVRGAASQSLGIGIGRDEFDPINPAINHVLHGVTAAAAHANHLDFCSLVESFFIQHFDGHRGLLVVF